ncbi:hypothetical protein HAX39_24615 [Citrobacter freundii]|nr:hypothetical protein [Citrobacter freundii]
MQSWITLPAIVPEFDSVSAEEGALCGYYPVSVGGFIARVHECATGWVLMIKLTVSEENERWHQTASLMLVASRLFRLALIHRDEQWWLSCRYAANEGGECVARRVDLQRAVASYLGTCLLPRPAVDTDAPVAPRFLFAGLS